MVEVLLKPGFIHGGQQETVWVFGKDRYESNSYSLKDIKDDFRRWMDGVKAVSNSDL